MEPLRVDVIGEDESSNAQARTYAEYKLCPGGRALDLVSMVRDPCEVDVVTGVPLIDGQPMCEFVTLFHSILVTCGYDARLAWDHAHGVDVSARCGSRHKHVA